MIHVKCIITTPYMHYYLTLYLFFSTLPPSLPLLSPAPAPSLLLSTSFRHRRAVASSFDRIQCCRLELPPPSSPSTSRPEATLVSPPLLSLSRLPWLSMPRRRRESTITVVAAAIKTGRTPAPSTFGFLFFHYYYFVVSDLTKISPSLQVSGSGENVAVVYSGQLQPGHRFANSNLRLLSF